ncbi:PilN domain-containing protein [Halomonas sp. LS-001]
MINLLPWRDARREQLTRRFYVRLIATLVLAMILGGLATFYYDAELKAQQQRNDFIRQQILQLDDDIRRVQEFKADAEALSERLTSFQNLQNARGATVVFFNNLSASIVDGVVYQRLSRNADLVSVTAEAGTDRQVSEQLRQIEKMPELGVPALSEVEREASSTRRIFRFDVRQMSLAAPDEVSDE